MTHRSLFDTPLALVQAPMAGVQNHALAAAACRAGALGSLPAAMLSLEQLRAEVQALSAAAAGAPINLNFFCHAPPEPDAAREAAWRAALAPYGQELGVDVLNAPAGLGRAPFSHAVCDVIEPFKPAVVSFHFGLPAADLVGRVKAWGATVLSSATTVEEARWLEAQGVDGVIAQGVEAGGHRGMFLSADLTTQLGTFALLPQVVAAIRLPVIAAGGIADAAGVRAACALGASAVQVGTSYLLCTEATTSKVHRAALVSRASEHTALTNLFTGRPARGIVNRVMRELGSISALAPAFPLAGSALAPLRAKAEAAGSGDFSPLWSGENPRGCRAVSAAEMTAALAEGFSSS